MEKNEKMNFKPDPGWRSTFSIIVGVGWLIFLILWLAFYASNMTYWEQNFAIILASVLVAFTLLGGVWAAWGLKKIPKEGKEIMKTIGFKWRIQTSVIVPFAAIVFLVIWFWFTGGIYTIWHHIAIILVTILAVGGILGPIWTRWSMKHGDWNWDRCADSSFYHHKKDDNDEVIDIEKKVDEKFNRKDD